MAGMGPGEREPLRIAGYVLLGVAALAAIIGLIHMASGSSSADTPSDTANQAAPSSDTAAPTTAPLAPTPAPGAPNNLAAPAVPAPAAPVAPAPGAPAAPVSPAPAGPVLPGAGLPSVSGSGNGSSSARKGLGSYSSSTAKAPARVYNNSLIKGLAEQAAADMRGSGWTVTEVGNFPGGNITTSTVYYRPGTGEVAAAKHLASSLGMIAAPRFQGIADASPGLIVIVTKDYQRR